MRIIITGVTGMKSRGGDALATTICQQLRARFPRDEIHMFTPTPEFDAIRLEKDGVIVDRNTLHEVPGRWGGRVNFAISTVFPNLTAGVAGITQAKKLLRSADLIVCTGGDIFSSDYGSFEHFLLPLKEALAGGAKIVFLAMSIGPFKTPAEGAKWMEVGARSSLVTTRELRSYDYVIKELKMDPARVHHTADPAFLLEMPPAPVIESMARYCGLQPGRPTVALAPSHGVSKYSKSGYERYVQAWEDLVRHVSGKMGLQVLLIPHVQRDEVTEDDCILCTALVRRCGFNPSIRMASGDLNASELKGLISTCDLVVAERMHAAIAGLSSGRPTALIGYSVKAFGVAADFVGDRQADGTQVIPVKDFMQGGKAIDWVEARWAEREQTGVLVRERLPEVQQRAMKNFDLVKGLFGS